MAKNAKDIQALFPLKVLVYGTYGAGKTLFGSTFPNPHVIDLENGIKTLAGMDIPYELILEDPDKKGEAIQRVRDVANEFIKTLTPDDTLVVDSLTTLNEYADNLAVKTAKDKFARWELTLRWTKDFVDKLIMAPFNVVMTCQQKIVTDDEGNLIGYIPMMYGQSSERIPYKFDEVYYMSVDIAGNRTIMTDKGTRADARSRLNREGILDKQIKWKWDSSNPHTNPIFEKVLEAERKRKN